MAIANGHVDLVKSFIPKGIQYSFAFFWSDILLIELSILTTLNTIACRNKTVVLHLAHHHANKDYHFPSEVTGATRVP